jgi:CheY-like chemotaxis protein
MTILVVDDEPEFRLMMRTLLAHQGWDILMAEDGMEGLEKAKHGKVDLIISDIYMPIMDGIKFHRKLRETPGFEKIPFLFVSAYDDQHSLDAVKDPRYDGFLKKATRVDELLAWIAYLVAPENDKPELPSAKLMKSTILKTRTNPRGGSSTPIL